jgi:hypothetical protein
MFTKKMFIFFLVLYSCQLMVLTNLFAEGDQCSSAQSTAVQVFSQPTCPVTQNNETTAVGVEEKHDTSYRYAFKKKPKAQNTAVQVFSQPTCPAPRVDEISVEKKESPETSYRYKFEKTRKEKKNQGDEIETEKNTSQQQTFSTDTGKQQKKEDEQNNIYNQEQQQSKYKFQQQHKQSTGWFQQPQQPTCGFQQPTCGFQTPQQPTCGFQRREPQYGCQTHPYDCSCCDCQVSQNGYACSSEMLRPQNCGYVRYDLFRFPCSPNFLNFGCSFVKEILSIGTLGGGRQTIVIKMRVGSIGEVVTCFVNEYSCKIFSKENRLLKEFAIQGGEILDTRLYDNYGMCGWYSNRDLEITAEEALFWHGKYWDRIREIQLENERYWEDLGPVGRFCSYFIPAIFAVGMGIIVCIAASNH